MSPRIITIGVAMLLSSAMVPAQQRGTVELGAFGSVGSFDKELHLDKGVGAGGRVSAFLHPRVALEFELGEMRASRRNGFSDLNVGILSSRLTAIALKGNKVSLVVGAGAGTSTETKFLHSYGVNALVGARFAIGDKAVIRIDGVQDWLANNDYKAYRRLLAGISLSRNPHPKVRVDTVNVPMPTPAPIIRPADSVSAAETARLRRLEMDLRALRDSISRNPPRAAPSTGLSSSTIGTMEQKIFFDFDRSALTAEARGILDQKVPLFQANPTMRILIIGHTDPIGTDNYNLRLGLRRAESAKAYLVSKGVDGSRIETVTKGESELVVRPPTNDKGANAPNRRDEFRLVMMGSGQ